MNIVVKKVPLCDENIVLMESIRQQSFDINCQVISKYTLINLVSGDFLPMGIYYNDELIGAAYLSVLFNDLFFENVFIKKQYQNNEMHFGSILINGIFNDINKIRKYFNKDFLYARLEDSSGHPNFYKNLGFNYNDSIDDTYCKKRI